jgi:hypothetical protein
MPEYDLFSGLTREVSIQAKFIVFFKILLENSRGMFSSNIPTKCMNIRTDPQFS